MTKCVLGLASFFVSIMLSPPAGVLASPSEGTGIYYDWKGEIDEVTVVRSFRTDSYRDIVVEPVGSAGLRLPDQRDKNYEPVRAAVKSVKAAFIDGLRKNLRQSAEESLVARRLDSALVVRARLIEVDPGSENARYFLGFGAGAVRVAVMGEIFDAKSYRTLVTFKQERRSAVAPFGSTNFTDLFTITARQIGGDIAKLINAF